MALDWHNGRRTPDADPGCGRAGRLTLATSAPADLQGAGRSDGLRVRAINERMLEEGVPIDNILAIGGIARQIALCDADDGRRHRRSDPGWQTATRPAPWVRRCSQRSPPGLYGSVQEAQQAMCPGFSDEYLPDMERHAIYDRLYDRYLKLGGRR